MENLGLNDIKTTYQNDYIGHYKVKREVPKLLLYDPLKRLPPIKQPLQKDLQTMNKLSNVYVPFDLMFRPKDCINTNPHKKVPIVKLEDTIFEEKLEMRKIRPRVYILPQICLDDVPVDVMYGKNGLADNIYTSNWKKSTQLLQNVTGFQSKTAPDREETEHMNNVQKAMNSTRIKPSHSVTPMEPVYLKYIKDWDKYQSRAIIDKDKVFWSKNMDKGLCVFCEGTKAGINLTPSEKAEIQSAMKDDQLRSPYASLAPGYGGYIPKFGGGIPVRKKIFKRYEPFVTTLMEVQGSYLKPEKVCKGK